MKCPNCGSLNTKVYDSRLSIDGEKRCRKHICQKCGMRFNTTEVVTEDLWLKKKPKE